VNLENKTMLITIKSGGMKKSLLRILNPS